jgi:MFS family permease
MTDIRLLRRPGVWTVNANSLLACVGLFGFFLIVPKLAQTPTSTGYGLGASVLKTSLYLVPMSIAALLGSISSAFLVRRVGGKWTTVAGTTLGFSAFLLLALGHGSVPMLLAAVSCNGAAIGLVSASSATLLALAVPQAQIGEANGMTSMFRNVGATTGATVMASILAASLIPGTAYPTEHAYTAVYVMALGVLAVAGAMALLIPDARQAEAHVRGAALATTEAT